MAKQATQKRAPATRKSPARTMQVMKAEPVKAEPSHEAISRRAYELFDARGGLDGNDMSDWFMAERELRSA